MEKIIYLDHAATTPARPEVVEAMMPYFTEKFWNPSSVYSPAAEAKKAVNEVRDRIAESLGTQSQDIYFTAGGSEADNWAIKETAEAYASKGKHIITSKIEHHAVLHTCQYLERNGYEVTYLDVDVDALGVFEEHDPSHRPAKEGFNSVNEGFMHACGHDGHATIGLGVAKVLMSIKDQLHGTVKLIFQPAEEGVRGAKSIVDNGHLDGVDYLIGSHVTNKKEDDPAVVIPGSYGSLATTKYDVIFHGKSAHAGGSPEVGRNVMLAVGTAILNLYAIPRHSGGVSRVNVGTVVAGSGRNVIADEAKMEIEVRGETTEINEYMKNYAVNIIESAAKMHGCTCEMKLMGAANSLASSEALMERVKRVCEEDLHLPVAKEMSSKNGGSEDVSYMMNRVQEQGGQATFMRILTHEAGPGHSRIFDIDEQVLPNAVKIFCGVVYDIMH